MNRREAAGSGPKVTVTGPPTNNTAPSNGPKNTVTGPPMNSALGRRRRSRFHRARGKRQRSAPSRPV